jgi:hypothetical protein
MNRTIPRKNATRPAVILAAILFAAFVVRVIFLVELERSELGDALSLDSQLYYDVARDISNGGALPHGALSPGRDASRARPPTPNRPSH